MPKICNSPDCNYNVFGGGYCVRHQYLRTDKKPKPLKSTALKKAPSPKKVEQIAENKQYYAKAIHANIIKNKGKCRCDECGHEIRNPIGRNVAHIIGKGANTTLYHDMRNHLILGKGEMFGECNCLWEFDESGYWEDMNVASHVKQVKETLNREYYSKEIAP